MRVRRVWMVRVVRMVRVMGVMVVVPPSGEVQRALALQSGRGRRLFFLTDVLLWQVISRPDTRATFCAKGVGHRSA